MSRKNVYLLLAIIGGVLPYLFFFDFFAKSGISVPRFIQALFVNGAAGGFTADLLISSFVFWYWSFADAKKHNIPHWWIIVLLNLTIGLSCAMPFYFYLKEKHK